MSERPHGEPLNEDETALWDAIASELNQTFGPFGEFREIVDMEDGRTLRIHDASNPEDSRDDTDYDALYRSFYPDPRAGGNTSPAPGIQPIGADTDTVTQTEHPSLPNNPVVIGEMAHKKATAPLIALVGKLTLRGWRSKSSRGNHPSNEERFLETTEDVAKKEQAPDPSRRKVLLGLLGRNLAPSAIDLPSEQLIFDLPGVSETPQVAETVSRRKLVQAGAVAAALVAFMGVQAIEPGILPFGNKLANLAPGAEKENVADVEVHTAPGAWVEAQMPTVLAWEKDVFVQINEYNNWAKKLNADNPSLAPLPYGLVDTGLVLATMAVVSGGNPAAHNPIQGYDGLAQLDKTVGSKAVKDFEPLNTNHAIAAMITVLTNKMSQVPPEQRQDRTAWVKSALAGRPGVPGYDPADTNQNLARIASGLYAEWKLSSSPVFDGWSKPDPATKIDGHFQQARTVLILEGSRLTIDGKIKPQFRLEDATIKKYPTSKAKK